MPGLPRREGLGPACRRRRWHQIAEDAAWGRATLCRHQPTRKSLLRDPCRGRDHWVAVAFEAAVLEDLPADRAISGIVAVFLREGAEEYAAVINRAGALCELAMIERTIRPIQDVVSRGLADRVLRTTSVRTPAPLAAGAHDLPGLQGAHDHHHSVGMWSSRTSAISMTELLARLSRKITSTVPSPVADGARIAS